MGLPRIGILGLFGECNAFRAPIPAANYRWMCYHEGESLLAALEDPNAFLPPELRGFCAEMDRTGAWEPVPLLYAISESGPPLEETHFLDLMRRAENLIRAAGRLDGIYITGHGSLVAERTQDTDSVLLRLLRDLLGTCVPIVETLDPHGKITPPMAQLADMLIAYQTDPHTDMTDRGAEAAIALRRMLAGERFSAALVRLPIQLTTAAIVAERSPFRPTVELGQAMIDDIVTNTSVLPGYPWTDIPDAGQYVIAYCRGENPVPAEAVALKLAHNIWDNRDGYAVTLLPLDEMVAQIKRANSDPSVPPLCFADLADNPGGGATSNTMYALQALLDGGVSDVAVGPIYDAKVAGIAHAAGLGAEIDVIFNEHLTDPFAKPLAVHARVTGLADGQFRARSGPARDVTISQEKTAALMIGGVTVIVNSRPLQAMAVEQFEMAGVDLSALRAIVVKSRGHYQAAFSEFFARGNMTEIDAPGWCTPHLELLPYKNSPAHLYPANRAASWNGAPDYVKSAKTVRGEANVS